VPLELCSEQRGTHHVAWFLTAVLSLKWIPCSKIIIIIKKKQTEERRKCGVVTVIQHAFHLRIQLNLP